MLEDHHGNNEFVWRSKFKGAIKIALKHFATFIKEFRKKPKSMQDSTKLHFRLTPALTKHLDFPQLTYFSIGKTLSEKIIDVSKPYYYLNLAYLFNHTNVSVKLFEKAYVELCKILNGCVIEVYTMGPSLLSGLIALYCNRHAGSRYCYIQHAVYQQDRIVPFYERNFTSTKSWLWGEYIAGAYRKQGVKHIKLMPNMKIDSVTPTVNFNWDTACSILIIGESSDKYYSDYDSYFYDAIKGALNVLKNFHGLKVNKVFFKPHPRSKAKAKWRTYCDKMNWYYIESIPNGINLAVIGVFSTYLLEALSDGFIGFQVQSNAIRSITAYDDYTEFSSLISVPSSLDELSREDIKVKFDKDKIVASRPFIDEKYLIVSSSWKTQYLKDIYEK